jgi:hypothetical protein
VEMEAVKLSRIVMKLRPDMYPFLSPKELDSMILLRDGIDTLEPEDAMEIIRYSICEHQTVFH